MYAVRLRLIGKLAVDFLCVLIGLFSLSVTAETLQANFDCKIGVFEGSGSVSAKFSRTRGHPPRTIYVRIDRPVNALQLCR